jgi:electron transfer flavoprotein beta subunit
MTTVVVFNVAREPAAVQVRADGSLVWTARKLPPAEDDHAAVAVAARLADASELVGITLGQGDPGWAAARGTSRVVRVGDVTVGDDDAATARVLAAAVAQVGEAALVVIGDSEHHPGIAPALAGHLGWPVVLGAASATRVAGDVEVMRRTAGVEEAVLVRLPAVVAVAATAEETTPPGMKAMLAARRLPVQELSAADLGIVDVAVLEPSGTRLPSSTTAQLFEGDPVRATTELVKALRAEGVLP